jgi:putative membrane protein insertion efficiency factor
VRGDSNDMKRLLIALIKFYRNILSPFKLQTCRFYPSCSEYAAQSIEKHGVIAGSFKAAKRLLRCHPFSAGGYDPVE